VIAGRYAAIGEYGVIGDLHTVALVGMDGSINILCLPDFDSPSVFAALVDSERGGRFQIAPLLGSATHKQLYLPDTNVLLPRPPSISTDDSRLWPTPSDHQTPTRHQLSAF
jgi:GH15 family glucan-1,4-alpha-glucosidase